MSAGLAAAPAHTVYRVADWPLADRTLWEAGVAGIKSFGLRQPRYADTLKPLSVALTWKAYGRFLYVLAGAGVLDPAIGPAERVTFETVAVFFDAMRGAGNVDNTIKSRLFHLRMALRIMVPKQDFDWITRPDGCALDSLLPQKIHHDKFTPTSGRLFKWGLRLVDLVPEAPVADPALWLEQCRQFRSGLIIALLACRAPRLGSLAQMRLGKNLYTMNGEYWVRLQSTIVKNKRELEYSLPPGLTPYIDRYLAEIRPALLDPASTDVVWGNGAGGAYTYRSIETMIFRQSLAEFGHAFGPHRFRHCLATSLAEADPRNPGVAAVVLGITEAVVNAHYRKALHAEAARMAQANLKQQRARTRLVAQRAFGR